MSEENQEEPSIEEILASIRQIISDDDEEEENSEESNEPADEAEPEPAAEPEPVAVAEPTPEPEPAAVEPVVETTPEPEDDILELTEEIADVEDALDDDILPEADESLMGDMDIDFDAEDDVSEPEPVVEDIKDESIDAIIEGQAAEATLGAFERLAQSIPVARSGTENNTLEDIVRDMLRPMLRHWVDENMPRIAERLVKKELERLVDKALD